MKIIDLMVTARLSPKGLSSSNARIEAAIEGHSEPSARYVVDNLPDDDGETLVLAPAAWAVFLPHRRYWVWVSRINGLFGSWDTRYVIPDETDRLIAAWEAKQLANGVSPY